MIYDLRIVIATTLSLRELVAIQDCILGTGEGVWRMGAGIEFYPQSTFHYSPHLFYAIVILCRKTLNKN